MRIPPCSSSHVPSRHTYPSPSVMPHCCPLAHLNYTYLLTPFRMPWPTERPPLLRSTSCRCARAHRQRRHRHCILWHLPIAISTSHCTSFLPGSLLGHRVGRLSESALILRRMAARPQVRDGAGGSLPRDPDSHATVDRRYVAAQSARFGARLSLCSCGLPGGSRRQQTLQRRVGDPLSSAALRFIPAPLVAAAAACRLPALCDCLQVTSLHLCSSRPRMR